MERQIHATYDRDSKHFHRFLIDEGQGITGTIYVLKDEKVPEAIQVDLKTKEVQGKSE